MDNVLIYWDNSNMFIARRIAQRADRQSAVIDERAVLRRFRRRLACGRTQPALSLSECGGSLGLASFGPTAQLDHAAWRQRALRGQRSPTPS